MSVIRWWVDASFATHLSCRIHTGATLSFGKGSVFSMSSKQKLNTRSSTEAELVGVNDVMSIVLWTWLFLEAQGFEVSDNILFQDNESTIKLAKNGRLSSGKQTRHIEVRYYFITDQIQRDRLKVSYCPIRDILADFFSKPLQGSLFRKSRNAILNVSELNEVRSDPLEKECVGPSMKDDVCVGTWVAADGGIPQDRTGLSTQDDKADPDNQGHGHKMAVTYADLVQGRAKAHTSRKI